LGSKEDNLQFLNGIFFEPSFVTTTVWHLQKVFMANACHLHFGKYTLFLCHRISANANTLPFAFAIMLGNEIMSSWHQFWNYALKLHPYLDSTDVTIITDQDKGQKNTIAQHLRSTISWHARQQVSIIKTSKEYHN
jgi:hypothetical protein